MVSFFLSSFALHPLGDILSDISTPPRFSKQEAQPGGSTDKRRMAPGRTLMDSVSVTCFACNQACLV